MEQHMTHNFDEGYEPDTENTDNSERRGFGRGQRPGFGPGFPFGGPGFGPGFPGFAARGGHGGHFGPRGFRGGRGLGGHLGEVVLAERFARGEIDATEYRERVAVLREVQAEGRAAHEAAREARSKNGKPSDA
ncbi:hypothetical protein ASF06_04340 [Agreia sp. Leaf244]|nr:hypothetical protein ASF06_04340 [Agreia sp. Leaf244]